MKSKKPRILIRTAGGKGKNKHPGFGHVFRTINLAKELRAFCDIYFLVEDFGGVKKILKQNGFSNIQKIQNNIKIKSDVKITDKYCKKINADLLIVDCFHLKNEYLLQMKKKIKTVIISDLRNIKYSADLLVNGFIGFKNKKIRNELKTPCLLGPSYQILSPEFQRYVKQKKKFTVLASFGGFDDKKISETFLEGLEKYLPMLKVKIILGPVGIKSQKLVRFEKKYPENLTVRFGTENMAREMSQARFGFCAGGLTTYEFAAMRVPFVMICAEPHQLITAREWHKRKIGINLGLINKTTKWKIQKIAQKIFDEKKSDFPDIRFVDGKGANRVRNEIFKMLKLN